MKIDCIKCHGKHYKKPLTCGHTYCPIYSKIYSLQTKKIDKTEFSGTSPGVFVGRYNYPNINVGIMAPPEIIKKESEVYDSPKTWSSRNFEVNDILKFRSVVINSKFESHTRSKSRYLLMSQELAMSSKPTDVEFSLVKKPYYQVKTSQQETIMGATAQLKKAILQSNPKIDKKVDYIVSDSDLKSTKSLNLLFQKGYDETFLTKLLAVGNLGLKTQRRLVPTRWAITATDDTLGKSLIKEVKDYKESDYKLYFGGYLGNYYLILFFPRPWSYELFEMYLPNTLFNPEKEAVAMTDYELFAGRTKYAENCVGGYYACRLGILEQLKKMKRQSSIVVLRFITDEYTTPLGVWVVREATRKALVNEFSFDSENSMLNYAKDLVKKRFKYDIEHNLKQSKVLKHIRTQRSIKDFF
jgi:DNA repair protein NreA